MIDRSRASRPACGHRALGAMAFASGVDLAGERRCPLGPSRQAATQAVPECSIAFRPVRVQPASADGPAGPLLPLPRHSGAGCGV